MGNWFEKHWSMNRKELQGLSFLILLVIALALAPSIYRYFVFERNAVDLRSEEQEILKFLASEVKSKRLIEARQERKISYFPFDPNTITEDEGKRLGLSANQIRMIRNYIAKGGRFHKREDFSRIYAISEADYQRLSPYILIPQKPSPEAPYRRRDLAQSTVPMSQSLRIELNSTDSLELQELKGIGPVFASRIIRFRDILGGFYDKRQLLDVYGMDQERFQGIEKHIYADSSKVIQLLINSADYATLSKHPLISAKQARLMVSYREQHGIFLKPEDLLGIDVFDEEFLRKIVPYLNFSHD